MVKEDIIKRISELSVKWKIILSIVSLIVLTIFLNYIIVSNEIFPVARGNDWIGYYGAIISGIISGSLTLLGVMLTIRHYNKKDERENLMKTRPYIKMRLMDEYRNLRDKRVYFHLENEINDRTNTSVLTVELENIGKGPALDLKFDKLTKHEPFKNRIETIILTPNSKEYMEVHYNYTANLDSYNLEISYYDINDKSYSQKFTIKTDGISRIVKIYKPELVEI